MLWPKTNWTVGAIVGAAATISFAWNQHVGAALLFGLYTLFCAIRAIPYWLNRP